MKKIRFIIPLIIMIVLYCSNVFAGKFEKSGEYYRYFNDEGNVVYDEIVEYDHQKYYINDNGYVVFNSWVNKNDNYYYAGNDGTFYRSGVKDIDKYKYYFNDECELMKGWIDNGQYYGDLEDGFLINGFQELEIPSTWVTENRNEKIGWFYFDTDTCKKYYSENEPYICKNVGSRRYCFDQNGIVRTGWRKIKDLTPEMRGYMFFSEETTEDFKYGEAIHNTWYSTEPPSTVISNPEVRYFYFNEVGTPRCAGVGKTIKVRVDNKTFLFNEYGYAIYGVHKVENDYYYFGPNVEDCSMKTGIINYDIDGSGEAKSYYFEDSGRGFSGVHNNKLYYKGKLQMAGTEKKYAAITVGNLTRLVNTSGTVIKNAKRLKDGDGITWSTNSGGVVTTRGEGAYENDPIPPQETGEN